MQQALGTPNFAAAHAAPHYLAHRRAHSGSHQMLDKANRPKMRCAVQCSPRSRIVGVPRRSSRCQRRRDRDRAEKHDAHLHLHLHLSLQPQQLQQLQPQPLQPQSSVTPQLHSLRLTQRLSAAKVMGGGTAKGHPHQRQQLLPLAEKVAEGRRTRSGSKARNQLRLQHQSLHSLSSILLEEDHHHHNHYLPLQLLQMRGLLRERRLP